MENEDEKLATASQALTDCQKSQGLDSCSKCEKMLECPVREEYVKEVYRSMNHGIKGGFDF